MVPSPGYIAYFCLILNFKHLSDRWIVCTVDYHIGLSWAEIPWYVVHERCEADAARTSIGWHASYCVRLRPSMSSG